MNPRISTHQATPDKQEMIRRRGGVAELSAPHREEFEIDKETTDSVVSAADESRSVEESRADAFKRRLSRLALDVHDGPMQNLTVIGLSLNDLKRRMHLVVPDEHQSNINESVAQITDELVQVEQELRSLISALESGSTQSDPAARRDRVRDPRVQEALVRERPAELRRQRAGRDRLAADRPAVDRTRGAHERRQAR